MPICGCSVALFSKSFHFQMRKTAILLLGLPALLFLTGCKSQESAYRQAYEKAKSQETTTVEEQPVAVTPVVEETPVVAVTPVTDNSDTRTIDGEVSVLKGDDLKTYSVVVGSFVTQVNAEGLMERLQGNGYAARVIKTNETINGHTGWYRVIAASFDDKASSVQSRDALRSEFPDAWLLYRK